MTTSRVLTHIPILCQWHKDSSLTTESPNHTPGPAEGERWHLKVWGKEIVKKRLSDMPEARWGITPTSSQRNKMPPPIMLQMW